MTVSLGIDTGGTYTDAVLVDHASGQVLASDKALTTRHDLSIGIGDAVEAVFDGRELSPSQVDLVALSTTLATNAIVEGQGTPICLLLIGYDPELIKQYGFERDLVTDNVVYLEGGHDEEGNAVVSLDEATAREAILAYRDRVEAFAISGYFSVRNPAHELRVRELVTELTTSAPGSGRGLPATCGHELTSRLNSVRRATTTALNARLIPLLTDLIAIVRRTLDEKGIVAPLMVVKGDGSLVRAEWAMRRPIETILSGPAASVVGAWHLAGRRDVWVVDVGGTTTDIAVLREGRPRLSSEGAQVGRWRTMVEAVDVHTAGLGGDSHVRLNGSRKVVIGPRRVVPLSLLSSQHSQIKRYLERQREFPSREGATGQFVLAQRRASGPLSDSDKELLALLEDGPRSIEFLSDTLSYFGLLERQIERLMGRRLVLRAAFTPTDALHVLGDFVRWDAEAARLGAELLARQLNLPVETFCRQVVAGVSNRVTTELVSKVLSDEVALPDWEREPSAAALLARALGSVTDSDLACWFGLRQPLVAVGAPVEAYMPVAAQKLHTDLIVPPHAEVANAVGAVVGSVVQQQEVMLRPLGEVFRLHLPDGVRDFPSVEDGVAYAEQVMRAHVQNLAHQAGADQVEIKVWREDQSVPVRMGWGSELYLETRLTFTAVGRPGSTLEK